MIRPVPSASPTARPGHMLPEGCGRLLQGGERRVDRVGGGAVLLGRGLRRTPGCALRALC
eukprot:scaffold106786_cov63-Phaeocystis_antarctica.AAC.5